MTVRGESGSGVACHANQGCQRAVGNCAVDLASVRQLGVVVQCHAATQCSAIFGSVLLRFDAYLLLRALVKSCA